MTLEALTPVLGAAAVALLVRGRVAQEVVGVGLLVLLLAIGAIGPGTALEVIVDPVVVTIACLFVMGHTLQASGALNPVAEWLIGTGGGPRWSVRARVVLFFLAVAILSAVVNNTAIVIIFIPVSLELARRAGIPATRLLIPVSFAAMLGGTLTLVGTSTNLLVADSYVAHTGTHLPFFSFFLPGLTLAVVGGAWLALVGRHQLPTTNVRTGVEEAYNLTRFVVAFVVEPTSPLVGSAPDETVLAEDQAIELVEVLPADGRERSDEPAPGGHGTILYAGDELLIRTAPEEVPGLCERHGLAVRPLMAEIEATRQEGMGVAQALVIPGSDLVGKTLNEAAFTGRFEVSALAVRHGSEDVERDIGGYRLRIGDTILVHGALRHLDALGDLRSDLIMVQEAPYRFRLRRHAFIAVAAIAAFVALAVMKMPTYQAGLLVVGGLILLNTVKVDEAVQAVDAKVLALVIGFLALGAALEGQGRFSVLQESSQGLIQAIGPVTALFVVYALVALVTSFLSNAATAVIFLPIALGAADTLGVDPLPYGLAVAFAASASFATPIGYQTNTLVYSVGRYSFTDFVRVGLPMTIVTGVAACLAILYLTPTGRALLAAG